MNPEYKKFNFDENEDDGEKSPQFLSPNSIFKKAVKNVQKLEKMVFHMKSSRKKNNFLINKKQTMIPFKVPLIGK